MTKFSANLRDRAELLLQKTSSDLKKMSQKDIQELVYELQVHQIELKMQNEELISAYAELQHSRDKYSDLYDFAPVSYLTINNHNIITEANLAMAKLLELSRTELINKKMTDFIQPESQDSFYLHCKQTLHSKEQQSREIKLKTAGKRILPVALNSIYLDGHLRIAVIDTTEREIAKQKLIKARDKAKAANKAKTEFLTNMSHEIRTPLNAIMGIGHILKRLVNDQKQIAFVDTLNSSADSLLNLINELLDVSKIEATTLELESVTFNPAKLISEAINMMQIKAAEKNIELKAEIDALKSNYYGDPHRLRQVIINLLGNAIKFTEQGSVYVKAHVNNLDDDFDNLTIIIKDTGIGIPAAKHKTIFQTFTQADASTTRKYGGTGLGLAICKKLVELMDGEISVESAVDEGAAFKIDLKLPVSYEQLAPLEADKSLGEQKIFNKNSVCPKILLVEDYAPNVMIAGTYLSSFNYEYDVAQNGNEAINKFETNSYDLILMDVQMHDMDGYEATRRIRKIEEEKFLPHTPVIAITAHALTGDREKCLQKGMDDYISKPFNPNELNEKIEYLLAKRTA